MFLSFLSNYLIIKRRLSCLMFLRGESVNTGEDEGERKERSDEG